MTPKEYEEYIAELYQKKGYKTMVTPLSGDWGIDVIAIKKEEKIAIQAKMYGNTSRKVNRTAIMQLYGAMAYQDCTKAVLATDGDILEDAKAVALKLNIEILQTKYSESGSKEEANCTMSTTPHFGGLPTFDEMWQQYILPLKGVILRNTRGENKIVDVSWAGITRITSNGKKGQIQIEGFKLAYNELLKRGEVTRDYINQQVDKRCSSGIVLILKQLPFVTETGSPLSLRIIDFKKES